MKKMLKRFMAMLLVVVMVINLAGCSSKSSQIKDTLSEFEYACQNLDVNAILRCIDPAISDPIRLGMALLSGTTGIDYEDIIDVLFENLKSSVGVNFDPKSFLSTLSLSKIKVKAKKTKATVTCKIGFEIAGEKFERNATIEMIKDEDKWYIGGFSLLSQKE